MIGFRPDPTLLEDEAYFKQVRLFFSGIGWPEGQDLGSDTIEADLKVLQ